MTPGANVDIEPIRPNDRDTLLAWLREPHLRPHYVREGETPKNLLAQHADILAGRGGTHGLVARMNGTPFGYVQWYLNRTYPDYGSALLGRERGVSLDYYIGNPGHLGRGLGPIVLRAALSHICPRIESADRIFFIGHAPSNAAAMRCTGAAGFRCEGSFVENGEPRVLFVRDER